jgi:hypothetical protein
MLVIIPVITFVVVFLDLLGHQMSNQNPPAVRLAALETIAFLGGWMLAAAELLSLFHLINRTWISLSWGVALLLAALWGWRAGLIPAGWRALQSKWKKTHRFDWIAGSMLAVVLALLFLTAVLSPSNNNDSLMYHMSRVMHWVQDQSLAHYATAYVAQLTNPIWAELVILNVHVLWGNDQLANMVQWSSLIGTLLAVSYLAKLLGASRIGQWLASGFAVSMPMAMLQATSTQNDLVTAFWLVSLLVFVFLAARRDLRTEEWIALACALGLGLATKATFYPYAVPPMVYFLIIQFKRHPPVQVIVRCALIAAIAGTFNLGYWARNWISFGGPLGPASSVQSTSANLTHPGWVAGSVVLQIAQNLVTPSNQINQQMIQALKTVLHGIDPQVTGFNLVWGWNHEDMAGNPLQLLLILASLGLLFPFRKRLEIKILLSYLTVACGLYIILAAMVGTGLYTQRYQLPFFAAWAPIFGVVLAAGNQKQILKLIVAALIIATLPWVLFNRTRPLIAMRATPNPFSIPCLAGCTSGSILAESPVHILFANWLNLQEPYSQATTAIRQSTCRKVGMQLDSHTLEYTFWWLLDAPQSGIQLESVATYPELKRYLDPSFTPCAILCTLCRGKTSLDGLKLVSDFSDQVQLFMGPVSSPIAAP